MRALVILVAVSCCSAAQLVPYAAPWVLPSAKLIPAPQVDAENKVVSVAIQPYANPFITPYTYPFATPYTYPYRYEVNPSVTALTATEFPFVWQETKPLAEAEATAVVEEARRRRRDVGAVKVPLPFVQGLSTLAKTTFETKHYEPVEAATPADTTKLALTTKEHEVAVPAVKYVQPVVQYKPLTYKVAAPTPLTYAFPSLPYYSTSHAYPYAFPATHVVKLDE